MRQKSDASDLIYPDLSALDGETRIQVEGMIEAEKRALLARRADDDEEECECKEGMFPKQAFRQTFFSPWCSGHSHGCRSLAQDRPCRCTSRCD